MVIVDIVPDLNRHIEIAYPLILLPEPMRSWFWRDLEFFMFKTKNVKPDCLNTVLNSGTYR